MQETEIETPVPRLATIAGLVLALSSALPITPDGHSFLDLLRAELARGATEGLMMLVGFGSPYLLGLAIAIVPWVARPGIGRRVVRVPLAFLHSQLVLVALLLWLRGNAIADLALLGFAIVAGVRLAMHTARAHAEGDGPQLAWYVRWAGMMLTAICAWMELQQIAGFSFGVALHVALGCGLVMVASLGTRSLSKAAPSVQPLDEHAPA